MTSLRSYFILFVLILIGQMASAQSSSVQHWNIMLDADVSLEDLQDELDLPENCAFEVRAVAEEFGIYRLGSSCLNEDLLERTKAVRLYEKDVTLSLRETRPNDSLYPDQWQMELLEAPMVWDITTGGLTVQNDEIVVAMIDEGYSPSHADIVNNLWTNPGEIEDDGIDNDGNGYIDDYYGFHFVDSTDTHTSDPHSHATAVAGIMGAQGDNHIGVAGVNWKLKILMMDPINPLSKIEEAMRYIYMLRKRYNETDGTEGAYVVALNMSFGSSGKFADEDFPILCALMDSLGEVGILSVAAAPNEPINIDEVGDLPNDCKSNYLISVTNTDELDLLVSNAGYGPVNMDLSAPGDGTTATKRQDAYVSFGGASAAAPYVTGTVALLYSAACDQLITLSKTDPGTAASLIRESILDGVEPAQDLVGMTTTEGRLDIFKALELLKDGACNTDEPITSRIVYVGLADNSPEVTIAFQLGVIEPHTIKLYDSLGRLWLEHKVQPSLEPIQRLTLDGALYPSAGYIAVLSWDSGDDAKKFVIAH